MTEVINQEQTTFLPEIKNIDNTKFYETFGNGTRIELLNSSFAIGKLLIRLQKFNNQNKEEARLNMYLDIDKALELAEEITTGTLLAKAKAMSANSAGKDTIKVFISNGGSNKNGKITYRELSVSKGKKWIISGLEMAGKATATGGFVADASQNAPKTFINVGVDYETLKSIAIMIKNEFQAYRTAQWIKLDLGL